MVMMTVMVMATVTVALATPNEPQNEGSNGQTKVTICHKGHTITVGEPAVAAHERHGDNITGPCGDEPQPEPTLVLTTHATQEATLGQPISDTATLSGATSDATGTINFKLYGPFTGNDATQDACTADKLVFQTFPSPQTPTDVSIVGTRDAQTGNYIVTSPEYTPTAVGRYQWVVSYSGDDNNGAALSECKAPNEASVVTEPTTTSTTEQNLTVFGWNGKAAKPAKATKLTALMWAAP